MLVAWQLQTAVAEFNRKPTHVGSPDQPLLVTETSGKWRRAVAPPFTPAPRAGVDLNSVSCTGPGDCSAVGAVTGIKPNTVIALNEVSGTWDLAEASGHGGLNAVSCSAPGDCSAVGYQNRGSHPYSSSQALVMTETSGVWGPRIHVKFSSYESYEEQTLDEVSCSSPGNCAALGDEDGSQGGEAVLVTESAGTWAFAGTAPVPSAGPPNPGYPTSELADVACTSGGCTAVGSYYDVMDDKHVLLDSESSGASWGADPVALPPAAPWGVSLLSDSCSTTQSCVAVGDVQGGEEAFPAIATGTGGSWTLQTVTDLPTNVYGEPGTGGLSLVSCVSAGNCSAVGGVKFEGLLLMTETSGVWGPPVIGTMPPGAPPPPTVAPNMTAISCSAPGDCSAVGWFDDSSGHQQGLLLTETAGVWGPGIEAALPGDAEAQPYVGVNSISCSAPGDCTAVGSYHSSGGTGALLLTETSGVWAQGVEVATPDGLSGGFSGISCVAPGDCSAVGSYGTSSGAVQVLLLDETSGVWQPAVTAAISGSGTVGALYASVSCSDPGDCSAAATYNDFDRSFERGVFFVETSGTWAATGVKANLAGGGNKVDLTSVSCSGPGDCSAVGSPFATPHRVGFLFSERSGVWAQGIDAPLPPGASSTSDMSLSWISCPSPGNCSAVGTDDLRGVIESSGSLAGGVGRQPSPREGVSAPGS